MKCPPGAAHKRFLTPFFGEEKPGGVLSDAVAFES